MRIKEKEGPALTNAEVLTVLRDRGAHLKAETSRAHPAERKTYDYLAAQRCECEAPPEGGRRELLSHLPCTFFGQ
jgi:hypothetical protein